MSESENADESNNRGKKRNLPCGFLFTGVCFLIFIVVIFLCIFQFRIFDSPIAVENFDGEEEGGWLVLGDAQGESEFPTLQKTGGNPGGYMEAVDDAVGGVWYWAAPETFRKAVSDRWSSGDGRSRAALTFDLRQSALDSPFEDEDVIFSNGTLSLSFNHNRPPEIGWTSYKVSLDVSKGWVNDEFGEAASEEEMEKVLGNLEKLWIRGEFRTGPDTGGIDNVIIR